MNNNAVKLNNAWTVEWKHFDRATVKVLAAPGSHVCHLTISLSYDLVFQKEISHKYLSLFCFFSPTQMTAMTLICVADGQSVQSPRSGMAQLWFSEVSVTV